jgi:uncharacterized protein YecE (DUF72 family)
VTARAAQIAHDIRVGTAGWSLPTTVRDRFPSGDSLLARYAQALSLVEINSSFYRPHRRATYARWAASTPEDFRFAVKAPRTVTHERRLVDVGTLLDRFFEEIAGLGGKLGPVLIQLPPSLPFEAAEAGAFLATWRRRFVGETALEPRHPGWFTPEAVGLLVANQIARVAADPATIPTAATPAAPGGAPPRRLARLRLSPPARLAGDLRIRLRGGSAGAIGGKSGGARLYRVRQHQVRSGDAKRPVAAGIADSTFTRSFDIGDPCAAK